MIRIALTAAAIGLALMANPLRADTDQPIPVARVAPTINGITLSEPDPTAWIDIPFGTPFHSSMRMLVQAMGPDYRVGFPSECPEGGLVVANFRNQISVAYLNDRMVGWLLNQGSPLVTSSGIALGTSVSYFNIYGDPEINSTSLGFEFSSGGFSGVLSAPDGEVTALWAGTNCILR